MERIIHLNVTQDIQHGTTIIFICCILIVAASFIDMWTGIDAARAMKEPISSRSLRKTVTKIIDYLRVLLFSVLIDILGLCFTWYIIPYCAVLATLGVLLIEFRSVIENSRKKRSHAAEIVDVVAQIVKCATDKDAEEIINLIKQQNHDKKNTKRNQEL